MTKLLLLHLVLFLCLRTTAQSGEQEPTPATGLGRLLHYPQQLSRSLSEQQEKISKQLSKQTYKYLSKLQRQEQKLKKQLSAKDSLLAKELQLGEDTVFGQIRSGLTKAQQSAASFPGGYAGKLDSMTTALHFLQQQPALQQINTPALNKIKQQYAELGQTYQQADQLKELVQQRKALLKEKLGQLPLGKTWRKYQKQVIYYQQQLEEYKRILNQPELLEQKALALLRELPAFRKFFDKYSFLGTMFRLPGQMEDLDVSMLEGLQTRTAVMEQLVSRMGSTATAQQAINQGMGQGQAELASLQNKLSRALESGESLEMPGFKPNDQKSKSFLKRIELGSNLQTVQSSRFYPVTSDIGVSVGYKLNQKSVIGVGLSYKMGWGQDIRHMTITHQGMGMRSFVDIKIQKSWWITGGGEWNYRQKFNNLSILKTVNQWQQSALLGIQKKQKLGKYSTTASVLYDALWNQHVPQSQPILFRVGYNFK